MCYIYTSNKSQLHNPRTDNKIKVCIIPAKYFTLVKIPLKSISLGKLAFLRVMHKREVLNIGKVVLPYHNTV